MFKSRLEYQTRIILNEIIMDNPRIIEEMLNCYLALAPTSEQCLIDFKDSKIFTDL